jgi:hypothetical protein
VQFLDHQCTWHKLSHPEDVVDATEAE